MNIRNLRNFNRNYGNCCKVSKVSNLNAKLERNLYPNLKKMFFQHWTIKSCCWLYWEETLFCYSTGTWEASRTVWLLRECGSRVDSVDIHCMFGVMLLLGPTKLGLLCVRVWLWNHVVRINLNCDLPLPYIVKISPITPTACYTLIPFPVPYHHHHTAFYSVTAFLLTAYLMCTGKNSIFTIYMYI